MAEDLAASEVITTQRETVENDEIRRIVADVYTFVRSREINKAISSFTLDHYIDERKREIKGERIIRSASRPGEGVDRRPAQLDAITRLEEDFKKGFTKAKKMAESNTKKAT
jgi:hypothetical protein